MYVFWRALTSKHRLENTVCTIHSQGKKRGINKNIIIRASLKLCNDYFSAKNKSSILEIFVVEYVNNSFDEPKRCHQGKNCIFSGRYNSQKRKMVIIKIEFTHDLPFNPFLKSF